MNILEAIKTGKHFRRPDYRLYLPAGIEEWLSISRRDAVAEDWEVQDQKITIEKTDLRRRLETHLTDSQEVTRIMRLLGFGDDASNNGYRNAKDEEEIHP